MDQQAAIDAIQHHAGLWKDTGLGVLAVTGDERADWLQGMVTCDVQLLSPGESRYGCALDVKGRILTDFQIYNDASRERLALVLPSARIGPLCEHLDMLLVAEDAELEPQPVTVWSLQGPNAAACLNLEDQGPDLQAVHLKGADAIAFRRSHTGQPGFDLVFSPDDSAAIAAHMSERNVATVDTHTVDRFRVFAAIPYVGVDTAEKTLPLEAGMNDAIHWGKGCYLGQEVVRRLGDRGHTNKELRRVDLDSTELPPVGTELWPDEDARKAAGQLSSVAVGPDGRAYGLAMLRRKHFSAGTRLRVGADSAHPGATVSDIRMRAHAPLRDENDPDLVGATNKPHRALV